MAPKEMDRDDIRQVIALHVEAAKRSLDAGFDIWEIHGAHGYIIQQFLSPITNKRIDGYGGDIQGRKKISTPAKPSRSWSVSPLRMESMVNSLCNRRRDQCLSNACRSCYRQ